MLSFGRLFNSKIIMTNLNSNIYVMVCHSKYYCLYICKHILNEIILVSEWLTITINILVHIIIWIFFNQIRFEIIFQNLTEKKEDQIYGLTTTRTHAFFVDADLCACPFILFCLFKLAFFFEEWFKICLNLFLHAISALWICVKD